MREYKISFQITKNFIKTVLLIALLAGIILAVGAGIGYLNGEISYGIGLAALIAAVIIPFQLFLGSGAVLRMTRGTPADPVRDAGLLRMVEELSRKAGLKVVPKVYITPSGVPNAFASGMTEKSAFVGVTQSLLNTMSEDELRGVLAHEIGHIVHRDIMLTQLSVAMVSVILVLSAMLARMGFWGGRGRSKSKNSDNSGFLVIILILLSILARPIAMIITNLIQMAISRKREYAADAYAAKLCGSGRPLSDALIKIGGVRYDREQTESLGGEACRAMYINFPGARTLFSSHPPIEERVRLLREMN